VVWKKYSTSQSNYISIARIQVNVQGNGFDSIDTSTLSLWQALSEPVVTFMPGRYRFIISFVMDGTQVYGDDDRHRIAAMVSMNAAGTAWQAPYTYEGNDPNFPEFVSSPWHAPAITCYNGLLLTNTCLMMYKQFRTSDTRWIDQQAFSMDSGNTRIISSTTDWSTWNYSHAELTIASSLYDWLYTHVYYNGGKGRMMYRIKRFSQGAGGHYRLYGTFERPDMVSRVGFPVAYNYRTNKFRFFWIER